MAFDTNKLQEGKEQTDDLFDIAELHGYNIIKCVLKKVKDPSALHSKHISGFEIIKSAGPGMPAIVERGMSYYYPDGKGAMWLFVVDTEYNREILKSHLSGSSLRIVDKVVEKELIAECEAQGVPTEYKAPRDYMEKYSRKEENLVKEIDNKDTELLELKAKAKALEAELEKKQVELDRKTAYRESNDTTAIVKDVEYDAEIDEVVEIEKEVQKVKTVDPKVLDKKKPAGKKLSGVKAKKTVKK